MINGMEECLVEVYQRLYNNHINRYPKLYEMRRLGKWFLGMEFSIEKELVWLVIIQFNSMVSRIEEKQPCMLGKD